MESTREVYFSSFLAGVLMVQQSISNTELSFLMAKFECENDVSFCDDYFDVNYRFMNILFEQDDNGFKLLLKYDDNIVIDGNSMTVYDYLHSFTDDVVRVFFNIEEKNISDSKSLTK